MSHVQLRRLLLTIARREGADHEIAGTVAEVDPPAVVALARDHRVVSLFYARLAPIEGIDPRVIDGLGLALMAAHARQATLYRTLEVALEALDVPALVVKGHALADWYDDPSSREFNDIDLVVGAADFPRALDALSAAGITPATTNWHGFLAHEVAEVPLRHRGSVIDLHWHVVATGRARRHLRLPTAELFERAVATRVGGHAVYTLGPVDTLLHLCVNAGLGGGRRLRSLLDVDAIMRRGRVDFAEFAARVRRAGAGRLCAAMLQRAAGLLSTPVPPELPLELAPGRLWLNANRIADRTVLDRRNSPSVASGLLMSSGRDSTRTTLIAFTRELGRAVAVRCGMPDLADRGGALDWQRSPDDGRVDSHRRDYLDWVTTVGVAESR